MTKNYLFGLLVVLFAITALCWWHFYHSYSLNEYITTPYFALDKLPGHFDSPVIRLTFAVQLLLCLTYVFGYIVFTRLPDKRRLGLILATFLLIVFFAIFSYPVGALDVFYYLHNQKLFFSFHLNPYLVTFDAFHYDPLWQYSIFKEIPLTYGPFWLISSWASYVLFESHDLYMQLVAIKIVNVIYFILTALVLTLFEKKAQKKNQILYLFLFNPLLIFEVVVNAHNDISVTLLLSISIFLLQKKSFASLTFLILSALVKPFTVILTPLYIAKMIYEKWSMRTFVLSISCALSTIGILFAPVWSGGEILNVYFSDMMNAQKLNTFSIFSIVRELILYSTFRSYFPIAMVQLNVLFLIGETALLNAYKRGQSSIQTMIDILLLFFMLLSLYQPWYLITLFATLILAKNRLNYAFLFLLTLTGFVFYTGSIWLYFNSGYSVLKVHLLQSVFVTVPSIVYIFFRFNVLNTSNHFVAKDNLAIQKTNER